jgi:NhaP-type Na+/H+ or K+/H+ antiporter
LISIPGTLFVIFVQAFFIEYLLFDIESNKGTWNAALMLSSIISSTDSNPIIAFLKEIGANKDLSILLEG